MWLWLIKMHVIFYWEISDAFKQIAQFLLCRQPGSHTEEHFPKYTVKLIFSIKPELLHPGDAEKQSIPPANWRQWSKCICNQQYVFSLQRPSSCTEWQPVNENAAVIKSSIHQALPAEHQSCYLCLYEQELMQWITEGYRFNEKLFVCILCNARPTIPAQTDQSCWHYLHFMANTHWVRLYRTSKLQYFFDYKDYTASQHFHC